METINTQQNKFFVYENEELKAAQSTFNGAMRFFKEGRKMYQGNPDTHNTDVTRIANKINKWDELELNHQDQIEQLESENSTLKAKISQATCFIEGLKNTPDDVTIGVLRSFIDANYENITK